MERRETTGEKQETQDIGGTGGQGTGGSSLDHGERSNRASEKQKGQDCGKKETRGATMM